jgi:hypothetical protein
MMIYTVTKEEYLTSMSAALMAQNPKRAQAMQSWGGKGVVSGVLIVLVFTMFLGYAIQHGTLVQDINWPFSGLMLVAAVSLIFSPIRYKKCLHKAYGSSELEGVEFNLQCADIGITVSNDLSRSSFNWPIFKYWIETESTLVLQLKGLNTLILPKRCFDPDELVEFRNSLTNQVKLHTTK